MACLKEKESMVSESRVAEPKVREIMSENRDTPLEELKAENRRLMEENERLKRKYEEYQRVHMPREGLYKNIHVSLKTMDRIIVALYILLGIVLAFVMIAGWR